MATGLTGAPLQSEMLEGKSQGKGDSQLMAALACFYVFSLLVVVLKPKDEFVMWYAKHGVMYTILAIFFWIMSFFGILSIVGLVGEITILGLAVVSSTKAMNGQKYTMPYISALADKISLKWLTDILQKQQS